MRFYMEVNLVWGKIKNPSQNLHGRRLDVKIKSKIYIAED